MLTRADLAQAPGQADAGVLVATPRNPVPGGVTAGHFIASDGARIRFAWWGPTGMNKLGTVCILMGRAEFIEKYFETVSDLRRRGFAVAIMDHRGQGGSTRPLANPRKGHVDDFAQYDADLEQFMAEIVLPDCPAPYYALAHSMGGNILLRATRSRMCWFDRIILTAPMIALELERSRDSGAAPAGGVPDAMRPTARRSFPAADAKLMGRRAVRGQPADQRSLSDTPARRRSSAPRRNWRSARRRLAGTTRRVSR